MLKKYLAKIKKGFYFRICLAFSVLFFAYIFSPKHISAETFNIAPNDTNDLISKLISSNNNNAPDVINLSPNSTYVLTTINNSDYLPTGLPIITSEITINGNNSEIIRDNNSDQFRIFAVNSPGNLILNNLKIIEGYSPDHALYGGGGIFNLNGQLTLNDVSILNSTALTGGGGGIWIGNEATANINNSTISNNSVIGDSSGGALLKRGNGTVNIYKTTFSDNYAQNNGGAIYTQGPINLVESKLLNNFSRNHGGGFFNHNGTVKITDSELLGNKVTFSNFGLGGAIYNGNDGTITITGSTFSNNTATNNGGLLFNRGKAEISYSCMSGNSIIGLVNQSSNPLSAIHNYWGAASGPTNNDISGDIIFNPFETNCTLAPAPSPTPTPTPSPTPEPTKIPIVLLPGLGGSWNTAAMISGDSGGSWKKTPFVKVYDNLKETFLSSAGYTEGNDYFEFYYDWRKPLTNLADTFKDYLINTVLNNKPADTKVNLVGHSLGGMVARTYAQKYGLDKINQIVTAGSPHQGAIKAWQGWSGAEIGDRWSWEWIGLRLYLQIHKGKYSSPVSAVRDLSPGLIDLAPIFDFAKNNQNQIISVATMNTVNSYLADLKTTLAADLKNLMTTISGLEQSNDQDTVEWIKLTERSLADQLLGKWTDGKPDSYEYTPDGDLTVLKKSAIIDGATPATINATHVELVATSNGIQAILDALGITATPLTNTNDIPRNPSLIFFLHSPAKIQVTAPDGSQAGEDVVAPMSNSIYSTEDKLLIIYNAAPGDYQVKITGTGSGSYQLEIGQLTKDGETWSATANNITSGQTDSYQLSFNPDKPLDNPLSNETAETYLELAKFNLEQLIAEINQQSISLRSKRNQIVYINQTIRLIDRALTYLQGNNLTLAERYIQTAVGTDYLLRQRVTLLNEVNAAGEWLIQAFIKANSQSAKPIVKTLADRELNTADKSHSQVVIQTKAKISGENETVGEGLNLNEEFLNQAQASYADNHYAETYIYSLVSRLLSQEISRKI